MAGTMNVEWKRGDTLRFTLIFDDNGDPATVLPLHTYTDIAAQIRQTTEAETAVDIAIDTTNAAAGELTFSLTEAVSATLTGRYFWDLEWRTPEGDLQTVLEGYWDMDADITRVAA